MQESAVHLRALRGWCAAQFVAIEQDESEPESMDIREILQGKRIFMIEDNMQNRNVVRLMLKQFEVEIAYERWGMRYLEEMRAFAPIDLVLLDMMFPGGINGYEIYDKIRGTEEFAQVPVVAVTATDPSVAVPITRKKGFSGFIRKPVDIDRFPQQLASILQNKPVWEE